MTVRKRGEHWSHQFMVNGPMYYGVLPDAKTKTDAKAQENEERVKIRKGTRNRPAHLDRFEKFVKEVFLKNSEETKRSYRHDVFRCRMLYEHFGGKRFHDSTKAKAVIEYQLNDATIGQYVFPSSRTGGILKEVKKGFASACEAAGIKYGLYDSEGVTFHTLRHWFNTKLEDLGVSKTVRRDLMGHTPVDVTDDYTHSTIDMRRKAVELLCHNSTERVTSFPSTVAELWQTANLQNAASVSY